MVNPNFKAVHGKNYEEYGLSKDRFEELKDKGAVIIIGSFINGLPVVFHTTDDEQKLDEFMIDSTRKYNELLKSAERLNTKTKSEEE